MITEMINDIKIMVNWIIEMKNIRMNNINMIIIMNWIITKLGNNNNRIWFNNNYNYKNNNNND